MLSPRNFIIRCTWDCNISAADLRVILKNGIDSFTHFGKPDMSRNGNKPDIQKKITDLLGSVAEKPAGKFNTVITKLSDFFESTEKILSQRISDRI